MILKVSSGSLAFLCSGQSGSGKTEATKLIVHYLSFLYEDRNDHLRQVFAVLGDVQGFLGLFFFQCWQSVGRHPLQPSSFLGRCSPWKCFPSWKVSEMPRPSSTTTPAASANTSTSTFSSRSASCCTLDTSRFPMGD